MLPNESAEHLGARPSEPARSNRDSRVTRVAGLGLLAFLAATTGSPIVSLPEDGSDSNESCTVSVPSGARLEWRRRNGKPAQFKVKKVEGGSTAAGLGYRPEDEILSIASVAISDKDLDTLLSMSREAGSF